MYELRAFTLSDGFVAGDGKVHREGGMRPAMVRDELVARRHPRVEGDPAYFTVVVLARVVERLGELGGDQIAPEVIEELSATDLERLRDLYREVNQISVVVDGADEVICPHCGASFRPA